MMAQCQLQMVDSELEKAVLRCTIENAGSGGEIPGRRIAATHTLDSVERAVLQYLILRSRGK